MISAEQAKNNANTTEKVKNKWINTFSTRIEIESKLGRRNTIFVVRDYSDYVIIRDYIVPEMVKLGYTVKWCGPFLGKTEFEVFW